MRVFINRKPVTGPWGGGNKTLSSLVMALQERKHKVVFELDEKVDIIFCMDPRPQRYSYQDLLKHKMRYGSKLIQRVGDVGSHSKPDLTELLKLNLKNNDMTIFTSLWAKNYLNIIIEKEKHRIIENTPLGIFYNYRNKPKNINSKKKLKIVTHHWSDNDKKGFDVYSVLGNLIHNKVIESFELTYIGRYSKKYSLQGIDFIAPVDKEKLSIMLPKYDIYLTGSLEEAGANHVLEAIAAGLPVLYRKGGGSINEYCKGYGYEYEDNIISIMDKISLIQQSYPIVKSRLLEYNLCMSDNMKKYVELIEYVGKKV